MADEWLQGLCATCLLAGGFETTGTTGGENPWQIGSHQTVELDTIGPYQVLRILGEGGMGTVYLAQQTNPIRRQVALKVIKPGLDTRQILARFEYERQALALMNHPNIARVYDAATEHERPYFVMEYIEGIPITEYCDSHRLNIDERLQLFLPVCQAVHHAHQKGVIHRDIKPSNVLVLEQDGRSIPKVIDFGIAKATDQQSLESSMFTPFGQLVGTPEYISPEQADVVTCDVDTTSDVYSLGVLLYELLVGAVPFELAKLRKAGWSELLRIIREEEAPALPSKLTEMGKNAAAVADRRRTDSASLRRQVTGDLNWIVLRAVEKDRHQRYPSVSDLAADIRRYLEDQPVLASPPNRIYRARKFVRRHRAAVLTTGGVTFALVVGLATTAWEASAARRERGIALSERAEVLSQKALADKQASIAERERQGSQSSRVLAESQAEEAKRQQASAERRLRENQQLAHSILLLDDAVKKASELELAKSRLEALTKILREDTPNPDITQRVRTATASVEQYTRASEAQPPRGWLASTTGNYIIGVDQGVFHSGKASAFIQCTKLCALSGGGLGQSFAANRYAGKRVRLTAFMKLQDVRNEAYLLLRAYSSEDWLAILTSFDKPKGNIDWHLEQLVMDVPANASALYIGAELRGVGEVWLDDFVLQAVDNSIAVTEGIVFPQLEPANLLLEAPHGHE